MGIDGDIQFMSSVPMSQNSAHCSAVGLLIYSHLLLQEAFVITVEQALGIAERY